MLIGIIDSILGFNKIPNKNIYEHIILSQNCVANQEFSHADYVCNIIKRENNKAEIILVSIMDDSALSCSPNLLLEALEILKNKNVSIVNLSIGIEFMSQHIRDELELICREMAHNSVTIIAAYSNNHVLTYPADFKQVIGIDTQRKKINVNNICTIDKNKNNILFMWDYVTTNLNGLKFQVGNSFLSAYLTGILSNFNFKTNKEILKLFEIIFNKKVKQFFYFPGTELRNKMAVYITDSDQKSLFVDFQIAQVKNTIYMDDIKEYKLLVKPIENYDIIILDFKNIDYYQENFTHIMDFIGKLPSNKLILCYTPYISCYERYILYRKNNRSIKCLSF